jgi:hypothetical protein
MATLPRVYRFYNDEVALGVDRQFLWGGGLLISPVLDEGHTWVDAYFPLSAAATDRWFSYYDVRNAGAALIVLWLHQLVPGCYSCPFVCCRVRRWRWMERRGTSVSPPPVM